MRKSGKPTSDAIHVFDETESPALFARAIAANSRKGTPFRKNKNLDAVGSHLYGGVIPIR